MITYICWWTAWSMMCGGGYATYLTTRRRETHVIERSPYGDRTISGSERITNGQWILWALMGTGWVMVGGILPRVVYAASQQISILTNGAG